MEIDYGALASALAKHIMESEEFREWCDTMSCQVEDLMREKVEAKFVDPVRNVVNFNRDEDEDRRDAEEMDFVMTLVHDLLNAFNKYYVVDYCGRKW
jgi:hypothetical protein